MNVEYEEYRPSLLAVLTGKGERKVAREAALLLRLTPGAPVRCVTRVVLGLGGDFLVVLFLFEWWWLLLVVVGSWIFIILVERARGADQLPFLHTP